MKRKLTTILYADAARFGARMEADEAATLEGLRRARGVMRACFEAHDGREVNTWGDAVIAEFASVVEAVRCAVAIQEALDGEAAGAASPGPAPLRFRIGVNLGDVMVDGEDLYGDGVNVAERLQGLADPGGIMVSGPVREFSRRQLALDFDFAGAQKVKSRDDKVESWKVRLSRRNAPPDTGPAAIADLPGWAGERGFLRWHAWYRAQPRAVRRAAGMIVFFFALNLVFSGLSTPWFIFPSLPFALFVWRRRDPRSFPWQRPKGPAGRAEG